MVTPLFSSTPGQPAFGARRAITLLIVGIAVQTSIVFFLLFMFLTPYHALRQRAVAFDASPNCVTATAADPASGTTPCTVELAKVINRYSSHASRSSYRYFLNVRDGEGNERPIELTSRAAWWQTQIGDTVKLQVWGDRITRVGLGSGPWFATAQNPDEQFQNDARSLRVIVIVWVVLLALSIAGVFVMRQYLV